MKFPHFRFEGTLNKEKKTKFKATLVHQSCLTDISEQFSIPTVYQWLDTVIASLDCYTWAFSQGFLNPILFQGKIFRNVIPINNSLHSYSDNNQQSRLIAALSYFIRNIAMNTLYDIVTQFPPSTQTYVFTPTDIGQFDT